MLLGRKCRGLWPLLRLLRTLRLSATKVLSEVRGFHSLPCDIFRSLPSRADRRMDIGILDLRVYPCGALCKGTLNEWALGESCSEENRVYSQKNP
jgi:hypothetical protein